MQTAASEDLRFEKAFCVTSFMNERLCRRNSGSGTSSFSTSSPAPSPNSREPAGPPDRDCASTILPAQDGSIAMEQQPTILPALCQPRTYTAALCFGKTPCAPHLLQTAQHGLCRGALLTYYRLRSTVYVAEEIGGGLLRRGCGRCRNHIPCCRLHKSSICSPKRRCPDSLQSSSRTRVAGPGPTVSVQPFNIRGQPSGLPLQLHVLADLLMPVHNALVSHNAQW